MIENVNGATAAATVALVLGLRTYATFAKPLDEAEEDVSTDWAWKLDPDLDRTDRAGASRRAFRPRVPEWSTSAILSAIKASSAAGLGYPFEGTLGETYRAMDEAMKFWAVAMYPFPVDDLVGGYGFTRAPGETDEALRSRVLRAMQDAGHV